MRPAPPARPARTPCSKMNKGQKFLILVCKKRCGFPYEPSGVRRHQYLCGFGRGEDGLEGPGHRLFFC